MAELTDEDIAAANERGRIEFETQPHAARAHYDRHAGLMTLELYNGAAYSFSPRDLQGLAEASDDQLAAFELSGFGYGLHWDELDVDFTVPGLLAGGFGNSRFMAARRARLGAIYDNLLQAGSDAAWDAQAAK